MSKIILKIPKGLIMFLLIIASSLKLIYMAQMNFNAFVVNYPVLSTSMGYFLLVITTIFAGLVYALVVRLMVLIGYKIANRVHIRRTMPGGNGADRLLPIDYANFRSIALGYMAIAAFVSALLNIPMYLYPLSYELCISLSVYIEVAAIIVMAFDLQNIFPPQGCKKAFSALMIPFGIFLFLRVMFGIRMVFGVI